MRSIGLFFSRLVDWKNLSNLEKKMAHFLTEFSWVFIFQGILMGSLSRFLIESFLLSRIE